MATSKPEGLVSDAAAGRPLKMRGGGGIGLATPMLQAPSSAKLARIYPMPGLQAVYSRAGLKQF